MANPLTVIRQDSTGNNLTFLQPNENYVDDGSVAVPRIEREVDGYVFDVSAPDTADQIFKPDASCINPFLPLVSGTANNSGRLQASILINSNFLDGGYLINYHDMRFPAQRIFGIDKVGVWNGSAYMVKPITSADAVIAAVNNIQTVVEANQTAIAAVQTTVSQNQTDILAVQTSVTQNQTDILAVQTTVSQNQTDILAVQTTVTQNQEAIAANQTAIVTIQNVLTEIQTTVNNIETSVEPPCSIQILNS